MKEYSFTTTRKIIRKSHHGSSAWLQGMANFKRADLANQAVTGALNDAGISDLRENDFNIILHRLPGRKLMQLLTETKQFRSVVCAETWYFIWIAECCWLFKLHTGIKHYLLLPADLPADGGWITNTAGHISSIANDVGDIQFSGQNIEHLWPLDISSFLGGSWRVLELEGLLVTDSPNRVITANAPWSYPEHTLKMTLDEARELVEANGLKVTALRRLWLCADPQR